MRIAMSIILAVWLLCVPASAEELHERFTLEELKTLLGSNGYGSPTIENNTNIMFRSSGTKLLLILAADGSLTLYCAFKPAQVSPEKINEWNRLMRYTRMFANTGGVAIVSDFLMSKGATISQVEEFIRLFVNYSMVRFQLFIAANRIDRNAPAAGRPQELRPPGPTLPSETPPNADPSKDKAKGTAPKPSFVM